MAEIEHEYEEHEQVQELEAAMEETAGIVDEQAHATWLEQFPAKDRNRLNDMLKDLDSAAQLKVLQAGVYDAARDRTAFAVTQIRKLWAESSINRFIAANDLDSDAKLCEELRQLKWREDIEVITASLDGARKPTAVVSVRLRKLRDVGSYRPRNGGERRSGDVPDLATFVRTNDLLHNQDLYAELLRADPADYGVLLRPLDRVENKVAVMRERMRRLPATRGGYERDSRDTRRAVQHEDDRFDRRGQRGGARDRDDERDSRDTRRAVQHEDDRFDRRGQRGGGHDGTSRGRSAMRILQDFIEDNRLYTDPSLEDELRFVKAEHIDFVTKPLNDARNPCAVVKARLRKVREGAPEATSSGTRTRGGGGGGGGDLVSRVNDFIRRYHLDDDVDVADALRRVGEADIDPLLEQMDNVRNPVAVMRSRLRRAKLM